MHIYLVGPMGSGKSRVGRALAERSGWPFHDLDRTVEAITGPLIPFFRTHGEEAFREREHEVLLAISRLAGPLVVATGGGTVLRKENRDLMRAAGRRVWLDVPLPVLAQRMQRAGRDRPLLHGLDDAGIEEKLGELYAMRLPLYQESEFRVDANALPEVVAERILGALSSDQDK
ncbi:MAG: shikimate kinase [Flavobacteriales bacterium]|nr:shikimate kinase [Flavobacteriales bacterium]